jgi:hypothetical protein
MCNKNIIVYLWLIKEYNDIKHGSLKYDLI